jgi:hypothetical protein
MNNVFEQIFLVPGVFVLGMGAVVAFMFISGAIEESITKHRRARRKAAKSQSAARASAKRVARRPAKAGSR